MLQDKLKRKRLNSTLQHLRNTGLFMDVRLILLRDLIRADYAALKNGG